MSIIIIIMSKATKRKHVTREVLEDYILPEENQQILKILGGRGNNLHEAQTAEGEKFLISMPTRFRKNVWIKRGDFVLADPILEGDKVKAEIVAILYPKQIKYIKEEQLWPHGFDNATSESRPQAPEDGSVDDLTNQLNDATLNDRDVHVECTDNKTINEHDEEEEDYSSEDNDDDLFVNTNRPTVTYYYSDSSEEEEEEEEEEEKEDYERKDRDGTDEDHSADR